MKPEASQAARQLPSLQALQALDAAARHGSYTAAAKELGVTHGAISHSIRALEERLQIVLFERHGRRMRPTRELLSLLTVVRQALLLLKAAFPPESPDAGTPRLVVATNAAFANNWLLPRLARFEGLVAGVSVEVRAVNPPHDFLPPGVDVAIRYGMGRWPEVHAEHLADEELFPVCSPEYAARLRLTQPADLARCALLRNSWQSWVPWLIAAGLDFGEPEQGLLLGDSGMLVTAAAAGAGVGLAKRAYAEQALAGGWLVRPFDISITDVHSYYAVRPNNLPPNAHASRFVDWLHREFKQTYQNPAPSGRSAAV